MKNKYIRHLVYAAVCLALCLLLPILTGQIKTVGKLLSPMHLPALLCGLLCGWKWGAAVGFAAPLLRFAIFGMPKLESAIPMAFELAAYGVLIAVLYRLLPKKIPFIYVSLASAMLAGRLVWFAATWVCVNIEFSNAPLTFAYFVTTEFAGTWLGIVAQIVLIPPIFLALRRAHLTDETAK